MYKFVVAFFVCYAIGDAAAQTYRTPDRIQFGNLQLNLSESLRKEIEAEVEALTRYPKYLNIKLDRAKLYFPIIERIFKEENIPDDFKYLVLQESALVADAVSTSNAIGFWQFKEPAAKEVGLRLDGTVDERMNITSATRGAARYLKKNNFYFDNWIYALIAYNTGRGGAERHVDKRNFGAKKMNLDKSLHWYAKKFLAHKIAFETALANYPSSDSYLYEFNHGGNKSLRDIAHEFSVNEDDLYAYNKWLRRGKIPMDKEYAVLIPLEYGSKTDMIAGAGRSGEEPETRYEFAKADDFPVIEEFEGFDAITVKINGKEGVVAKNNDNLRSLALIGNMEVDKFRKINDLDDSDKAESGHFYYFQKKRNKAKTHYHVLQPGEDLWLVSQKYGIKLKKLLQKNRLEDAEEIKPGRILWLRFIRPRNHPVEYGPIKQSVEPLAKKEAPVDGAVKSGVQNQNPDDFPGNSARRVPANQEIHSPSVENTTNEPAADKARGQMVRRKTSAGNQPAEFGTSREEPLPDARPKRHVVQPGETLYALSKRYNVSVSRLLAFNQMNPDDNLRIGQEIIIDPKPDSEELPAQLEKNNAKSYIYHKVEAGDTLYKIAREYNVTIRELMEWNSKSDFNVQTNETLKILK